MQAIEVETQNEESLYVGMIFSPTFPYWHIEAFHAFMNAEKPNKWKMQTLKTHGIAAARNKIVAQFLALDYTYFLSMDSDIILDRDTIAQMLHQGEEVVVANVPQKPEGGVPCIKHSELPYMRDDPISVKDNEPVKDFMLCGMGCVLIRRDVLQNMKFPQFRYVSQEFDTLPDYWRSSEDFYFFLKLHEMGIKPVFLPSAKVKHVTSAALYGKELVSL